MLCPSHTSSRNQKIAGFTLIELMTVMAVIIVLAGLTYGIAQGVGSQKARSRAKGEMTAITQALEDYKLAYQDYPWVGEEDSENQLYRALIGLRGPKNQESPSTGKRFLDISKMTLKVPNTTDTEKPNALMDPWGNPYKYYYKEEKPDDDTEAPEWEAAGFVLISAGPDGKFGKSPASGSEGKGLFDKEYFTKGDGIDDLTVGQ